MSVLVAGLGANPPDAQSTSQPSASLKLKLDQFENIEQLNMLQQSVWPTVASGRNAIIIGGKNNKKGKTLSYLLPLIQTITQLKDHLRSQVEVGDKQGPAVIIITASYKSAEKVITKLTNLTSGSGIISHLVNGIEGYGKLRAIFNETHPEIVVTTLNNVINMFTKYFDVFRFDRLRFLVFDDAQVVFKNELDNTQRLVQTIFDYTQSQTPRIKFQTIFCGTMWDDVMASAARHLIEDPVLHIANPEAATIYGGVQVQVHHVTEKLFAIAGVIESGDPRGRYMIVCQESSAVSLVTAHLKKENIRCIELNNNDVTNFEKLSKIKQWNIWEREEEKPILVITHQILKSNQNIKAPTHILHYDVPFNTPEEFWARHNSMWVNFPSLEKHLDPNEESAAPKTNLQAHVFICNEDDYTRTVLKFVDLGFSVPETLAARVVESRLAGWRKLPFCESILNFGKCYDSEECKQKRRHFFNEEEIGEDPLVPRAGRVEVELLSVIQVNAFMGKIIRTYEFEGKKPINHVSYAAQRQKIQSDLDAYYGNEANRVQLKSVQLGTLCGIQDHDGNFIRAIVKEIFQTLRVDKIRTFAIDNGTSSILEFGKLYELPESLRLAKPTAIEIIVANLLPRYGQPQYSRDGFTQAENWIGKVVTGDVALSIGKRVWVSNLREYSKSSGGDWFEEGNMRTEFLTNRPPAAAPNPDHLTNLCKLAEEKGMDSRVSRATQEQMELDQATRIKSNEHGTSGCLTETEAQELLELNKKYDEYVSAVEKAEELEGEEDDSDVDVDGELDMWMPGDENDPETLATLFNIPIAQLMAGLGKLGIGDGNETKEK